MNTYQPRDILSGMAQAGLSSSKEPLLNPDANDCARYMMQQQEAEVFGSISQSPEELEADLKLLQELAGEK